jgi:hypothetical protein
MGLLDRLSYQNLEEIPRNWSMTTLDTTGIKSREQYLLLSSSGKQPEHRLIVNPPQEERQLPVPPSETGLRTILPMAGESSTGLVTMPPKKKR